MEYQNPTAPHGSPIGYRQPTTRSSIKNRYEVGVTCPHCGHLNIFIGIHPARTNLVNCDGEDGGCDREFAVTIASVHVVADVFRLEPVTTDNAEEAYQ